MIQVRSIYKLQQCNLGPVSPVEYRHYDDDARLAVLVVS